MARPTHVGEARKDVWAALEDGPKAAVRLTVDREWLDEHGIDGLREVAPELVDELAAE